MHSPLSRTGTGAVSANDRRRLVDAGAVSSAEELDDLIASASAAGLAQASGRDWLVAIAIGVVGIGVLLRFLGRRENQKHSFTEEDAEDAE